MEAPALISLVGNKNTGKSTLFNALTGARQKLANYPGTTVEIQIGQLHLDGMTLQVEDLPGLQSLFARTEDERIARDALLRHRPHLVINVVDATRLESELYLTLQLLALGLRVIVVLNMMDEAQKRGIRIDTEKLAQLLGTEVVETVATRGEGIDRLKARILEKMRQGNGLPKPEIPLPSDFPGQIHRAATGEAGEELRLTLRRLASQITRQVLYAPPPRPTREDRIDRYLLRPRYGLPFLALTLLVTFWFTFYAGGWFSDGVDRLLTALGKTLGAFLTRLQAPPWFTSLINEGILGGVGAVLTLIPYILVFMLFLGLMEDTGYLPRVSLLLDRFFARMGFSGGALIPMLLGYGCNVPAILATRILADPRERRAAIFSIPLLACSARLTVFILFAAAFFREKGFWVILSLYILSTALALLTGAITRSRVFRSPSTPLLLQLPLYRLPSPRNLIQYTWLQSRKFLEEAGTIIFATAVFLWLLASLPPGLPYASEGTLLARIGKLFAPLLAPLGFGFWQVTVALGLGFLAKEVIIGALGAVMAQGESLRAALTTLFPSPLSAYAFLVFTLFYTPCLPTTMTIWKETRDLRFVLSVLLYSLSLAWVLAFLVFHIGKLLL